MGIGDVEADQGQGYAAATATAATVNLAPDWLGLHLGDSLSTLPSYANPHSDHPGLLLRLQEGALYHRVRAVLLSLRFEHSLGATERADVRLAVPSSGSVAVAQSGAHLREIVSDKYTNLDLSQQYLVTISDLDSP